jgi:hypothetical protein
MFEVGTSRIVLGDEELVIERVAEPLLERPQRPEVDHPAVLVALRRCEGEGEAQRVAVQEPTV